MRSYRFYCPTCDREGEMIIECVFSPDMEPHPEWIVCVVCDGEIKLLDRDAVQRSPDWKQ
jgi:hypothetical protein